MRPVLFELFGLQVRSFGFMLMVGYAAGVWWTIREARRKSIPAEVVLDVALWVLIGSIIGARLLYIALNWQAEFAGQGFVTYLRLDQGGLSFHGGALGGVIAGLITLRFRRLPPVGGNGGGGETDRRGEAEKGRRGEKARKAVAVGEAVSAWDLLDSVGPAVPLAYGIARFGCYLNGCCNGRPAHLLGLSIPTQIYTSLMSFVAFGLMLWLKGWLAAPGQVFGAYLVVDALERFIVEFKRAGVSATVFGPLKPLTQAQTVSVLIAVAAAAFVVSQERRRLRGARAALTAEAESVQTEAGAPRKKRVKR